MNSNMFYQDITFKEIKEDNEEKVIIIRGYPSTPDIDRVGDKILPTAFAKSIDTYIKASGSIFYNHNWDEPVGKIISYTPASDEKPIEITAKIYEDLNPYVYKLIKKEIIKSFSVGFFTKESALERQQDKDIYIIKDAELLDISVVSVPANPSANFMIVKSLLKTIDKETKNMLINDDNISSASEDKEEIISVKKSEWDCLLKAIENLTSDFLGLIEKLNIKQAEEIKNQLIKIQKIFKE